MLTELLESDVAAIATLSSLLEEVDMELPFSGKSAVKKRIYFMLLHGRPEGERKTAKCQLPLTAIFASGVESCRPVPLNGTGRRSPGRRRT